MYACSAALVYQRETMSCAWGMLASNRASHAKQRSSSASSLVVQSIGPS